MQWERNRERAQNNSTHPRILIRRWTLSSTKSSCIWPRSAAFPCEYSSVNVADGCFTNNATISFPRLVCNFSTSTLSRGDTSVMRNLPVTSSATTWYDDGVGGKNANLAATDEVTAPISTTSNRTKPNHRKITKPVPERQNRTPPPPQPYPHRRNRKKQHTPKETRNQYENEE